MPALRLSPEAGHYVFPPVNLRTADVAIKLSTSTSAKGPVHFSLDWIPAHSGSGLCHHPDHRVACRAGAGAGRLWRPHRGAAGRPPRRHRTVQQCQYVGTAAAGVDDGARMGDGASHESGRGLERRRAVDVPAHCAGDLRALSILAPIERGGDGCGAGLQLFADASRAGCIPSIHRADSVDTALRSRADCGRRPRGQRGGSSHSSPRAPR